MKNKIILGCLAAATCEILFGLSFIFTKSITAQVSDLALISWRFVTAFLFINLYFLFSRRRLKINGRNLKPLHKLTKDTQFIVITHRRGTMNAADILYGITMQEKGVSTLVSVNLLDEKDVVN